MSNKAHISHTLKKPDGSERGPVCLECGAHDTSEGDPLGKVCTSRIGLANRIEKLTHDHRASLENLSAVAESDWEDRDAKIKEAVSIWKQSMLDANTIVDDALPIFLQALREPQRPEKYSPEETEKIRTLVGLKDLDNHILTGESRAWLIRQLIAWPTRIDPRFTTNDRYLKQCAALMLAADTPELLQLAPNKPCDFYLGECVNCHRSWMKDTHEEPCVRPDGPFSRRT